VTAIYGIYTSTMSDAEVQATESEMAPKLAAFNDQIVQNSQLFARIDAGYQARDRLGLTPEQQRLLWLDYTSFVRMGAKLDEAAKQKLSALNQQLASLYTKFRQNLLAEENSQMVVLESE
jgi:peptidyl-dipeptidase Dcp